MIGCVHPVCRPLQMIQPTNQPTGILPTNMSLNLRDIWYMSLMSLMWGTFEGQNILRAQDGKYFEKIEKIWKKLTTPIFLVGLIYRWGKGPKTKNICINVTFSYTICEKKKKKLLFFTFLTFLTFWGSMWLFRVDGTFSQHFCNKMNQFFFFFFGGGFFDFFLTFLTF